MRSRDNLLCSVVNQRNQYLSYGQSLNIIKLVVSGQYQLQKKFKDTFVTVISEKFKEARKIGIWQ